MRMGKAGEWYGALRRSQALPDAWEEWRAYRKQVTDYIIGNSRPGTTFAVFGAGRCNDLDLARLSGHFSEITLFDMDEAAMLEAVRRCGLSPDAGQKSAPFAGCKAEKNSRMAKLSICPVDFVGISEEDYIAFADLLLQKDTAFSDGAGKAGRRTASGDDESKAGCRTAPEDGADTAERKLAQMYEKSRVYMSALSEKRFDYTAAIGVHSQLGNVPAWMAEAAQKEYLGETGVPGAESMQSRIIRLRERIRQENTQLAVRFNTLVLSAARRKAFIGCEVGRAVCGHGSWYAVPDSAVDGAWQAIQDIEQRAARGAIRFDNYLDVIWPFAQKQGVAYRMAVMEAEPAACRDCG